MGNSRTVILPCLNCGKKNRLTEQISKGTYKCHNCGTKIENPFIKSYKEIYLEQGTDKWKQWRMGGFGASDIPCLMGENPWRSLKKLIEEKKGHGSNFTNYAMRRGTLLEPKARKKYCEKMGIEVSPKCLQHNKYFWARASLDGISSDHEKVVEIKCGKKAYSEAKRGVIPKYYHGQLQHILFITGLKKIDYWCYLPDQDGILLEMEKDDSYISNIINKGEEYKYIFD